MSSYLWRYYLENDAESFQRLLSGNPGGKNAVKAARSTPAASAASSSSIGTGINGTSSSTNSSLNPTKQIPQITITRQILKDTDSLGRSIIHLAASDSARLPFLRALLNHPAIDPLQQDAESGWTPLHRALYNGNIAGAREIIRAAKRNGIGWEGLMRKDRNGETAFDIFNDTVEHFEKVKVGTETSTHDRRHGSDDENSDDDYSDYGGVDSNSSDVVVGDEVFTFGSNKNCNLGFGDQDDRQYPEKVVLHLTDEYLGARDTSGSYVKSRSSSDSRFQTEDRVLDALTKFDPIRILDIQMSKLHSVLLTTDKHDNLFVCGVGNGGRLGLGDDVGTQFTFRNVPNIGDGVSRVEKAALGLDHTLVVMSNGAVWSWGSNKCGQLGYDTRNQTGTTASQKRDEEPVQSTPRPIVALRKEDVIGVSASRIHSAAFTDTTIYVWGKNEGQMGIVQTEDKDSRTSIHLLPRKVSASFLTEDSRVRDVVATDKATAILLSTGEVYLLKDYTYGKVTLPQPPLPTLNRVSGALDSLGVFRVQKKRAHSADVSKIKGAGDTIALINRIGEVCVMDLTKSNYAPNGKRTKGICPPVQKVWDLRRKHMAVKDVSVDMGGSVIICTESGGVWRRMQRSKAKEAASVLSAQGYDSIKQEDYRFIRIPGLNRIVSVRSNGFGAFAAIRKDSDILRQTVTVRNREVLGILAKTASRWPPARARLKSPDDEPEDAESEDISTSMYAQSLDIISVADLRMPVHRFVLAGRIPLFRRLINEALNGRPATHKQQLNITLGKTGHLHLKFTNVTRPAVLHLLCAVYGYAYKECQFGSRVPVGDVLASSLQTPQFSSAYGPKNIDTWFETDLTRALADPLFSNLGDAIVDLAGGARVRIFSEIFRARSLFFDTLFGGSAQGHWIEGRSKKSDSYVERLVHVDLKHVKLDVFRIVALHVYTDKDEGLFDGVKAKSLSEFLDFVLDVLSIANELLLDRLIEICQKMLGAFGTYILCQG